jgi:small subunit ribosomal protein S14
LAKKASLERWKRDRIHPKFKVRFHNRCLICGRPRAYLRKFGMCRICFRTNAAEGRIPGVTKSSW